MTREEAIEEVNKVFEPAFANYIITALTEGATVSDIQRRWGRAYEAGVKDGLEQEPCEDAISLASVFEIMGNLMSIPYDFDRSITEKDVSESMDKIRELPRVTPQEPFKPMVEIDLYSVIKQKYIEREVLDNAIKEIKNAGYNNIVPIGEQIGDHRVKLCKVIEVDEVLKILEMNTGKAQSK